MNKFDRNKFEKRNLDNIKGIFESRTGVDLSCAKKIRRPVRTVLALAAVLACFTVTAFGMSMFSSLDGDDLGFNAVYAGDGIVEIQVENRSNKNLEFQEKLKLMRWSTGEEIIPDADSKINFYGMEVPAGQTGAMIIDLSGAYNIKMLEQPLEDDYYYLVLTNNNFVFGQDWMCSVNFCDVESRGAGDGILDEGNDDSDETQVTDGHIITEVPEELRWYFKEPYFNTNERGQAAYKYTEAVNKYLADFNGEIAMPQAPGLILDTTSKLIGENYSSMDAYFRIMGRCPSDEALVISAVLPTTKYNNGDGGEALPLFYIMTYSKSDVENTDCAFIYGHLMTFDELKKFKVYEDEQYVCYEVSGLIYSDVMEYAEGYINYGGSLIRWDDNAKELLLEIYDTYKDKMEFYYIR